MVSIDSIDETNAGLPQHKMDERLMTLMEESDNGVPTHRMSMLGYLAMVKGGGATALFVVRT